MAADVKIVDCGDSLTISHATELHQKILAALEDSSEIKLNATAIEKVDTAGLQVIVALSNELKKMDGTMLWDKPSEALVQAAATLGLTSHMAFE